MQREQQQQQQQVESLNRKIVELTSNNDQIKKNFDKLKNQFLNDNSLLQGELER